MAIQRWICERCRAPHRRREHIWDCPGCEIETCEACFDRLAHCRECAKDQLDAALRNAANVAGFDFSREEE